MITEDYVSFEVAKLLKEKDFDIPVLAFYWSEKSNMYQKRNDEVIIPINQKNNWNETPDVMYSCPTLQMAMKWLREVHKLHIGIVRGPKGYHITIETIPLGIVKYITRDIVGTTYVDSYEEAIEAALKYCLKNLI